MASTSLVEEFIQPCRGSVFRKARTTNERAKCEKAASMCDESATQFYNRTMTDLRPVESKTKQHCAISTLYELMADDSKSNDNTTATLDHSIMIASSKTVIYAIDFRQGHAFNMSIFIHSYINVHV